MMRSVVGALPAVAAAVVGLGVFASTSARAAVVFSDSFAYGDGNLVGQGPWVQTGTGTFANPLQVSGGKVPLLTSGQDANASLASAYSTSANAALYAGFDVNLSSAQSGGDYFFHVGDSAGTNNFYERLFAKSSGSGYVLGLTDTAGTGAVTDYGSNELAFGTTYHVTIAWNFLSGAKNDTFAVYVNPTDTSVEANNTAYVTHTWTSANGEPASIGTVNLRQGSASSAAAGSVDNLVLGSSFADAATGSVPEPGSLSVVGVGAAALVARRRRAAR